MNGFSGADYAAFKNEGKMQKSTVFIRKIQIPDDFGLSSDHFMFLENLSYPNCLKKCVLTSLGSWKLTGFQGTAWGGGNFLARQ